MTLTNQSKVQNVKASLEKYVGDSFVLTEGLSVDFEGLPFEVAGSSEWVQARFMSSIPSDVASYGRKVANDKTTTKQVIVSFNIFVNREKARKTNRHYELRDIVASYLELGDQVSLYDFENGNFSDVLQNMTVKEIITDMVIPNDDYYQYNYTVGLEWFSKRT